MRLNSRHYITFRRFYTESKVLGQVKIPRVTKDNIGNDTDKSIDGKVSSEVLTEKFSKIPIESLSKVSAEPLDKTSTETITNEPSKASSEVLSKLPTGVFSKIPTESLSDVTEIPKETSKAETSSKTSDKVLTNEPSDKAPTESLNEVSTETPKESSDKSETDVTPSEWKINAQIMIKENLHKWISEQESFPKGTEFFPIFDKIENNPVRRTLPKINDKLMNLDIEKLTEKDEKDILNFMKEYTRYSYMRRETEVNNIVCKIYDKYQSIPEIKYEFYKFQVKKNHTKIITSILKKEPHLINDSNILLTSFESVTIFKNCKESLGDIRKFTKKLAMNKVPITNKLIYTLYYTLPMDAKHFFKKELLEKMDFNATVFDSDCTRIKTFHEIKLLLKKKELKLSYGSYHRLVNLMCREFRIAEGLSIINYIILKQRIELPVFLANYTIEMIAAYSSHLAIPSSLFLQRITGCSLKSLAIYKIEKFIAASKVLDKDTFDLLNMLLQSSKWKRKEIMDEVTYNISKCTKFKSDELFELLEIRKKPVDELKEYNKINDIFQKRFTKNDIAFRPGFQFQEYDKIFNLFPNMKKFTYIEKDILDGLKNNDSKFNLSEYFIANISPLSNVKKDTFVRSCELIIDILLKERQYHKIVPFVNYIKEVNGIDITYTSYLKTIISICSKKELSNESIDDNTQLKLSVILANYLFIRPKMMIQELLDKYPILVKVLNKSWSSESNIYAKMYESYVEEVKWDYNAPPDLSIEKFKSVNNSETKEIENNKNTNSESKPDNTIKDLISNLK